MNGFLHFLLMFTLAGTALLAEEPAPPLPRDFLPAAGKLVPGEGDTLVFLGDSITHQCLYTQYIEDFYFTRFPKVRMHFHNAGTSGDRVGDALERLPEDVAAFKPQYVSILLGMNDGGFADKDQALFEKYQKDMAVLLDEIVKMGAAPILLTPTMYDGLPNRVNNRSQEPRDTAYNTVLGTYGTWLKELAKQRNVGFADFYKPLNDAANDQRRIKSDWTIIPDGMHPAAEGHVLMAAAFISEVAFHPPVSEIVLTRKDGKLVGNGANGTIEGLTEEGTIRFTFTAQSLPWVLPPDADEGRKLIKPTVRLGGERLLARNLQPGSYELKIDGAPVGQWTEKELAAGVELGENPKTPQYQQALKVALLNVQRTALSEHPLRVWWAQLKGQRAALKEAEGKVGNPPQLAQKKKAFDTWYEGMQKTTGEFVATSREMEEQIYQLAQPVPRKYELAPVPSDSPAASK